MSAPDNFVQAPADEWESDFDPCGTADPRALLPTPKHWNCRGCRVVILALIQGRVPMAGGKPRVPSFHPFEDRR